MRRTALRLGTATGLAAALAVVSAASAAASPPGGPQADGHRTETIRLTARQAQSQSLDLGTKGLSLGDELVIAEDLYSGGRKIGDHSVVCTYIRVQPGDVQLQCVGTFALPEGQITSQALLHLKGQATPAPAVDIALTGGSGAYSTARGYVHTVAAGGTERQVTFHITLDGPSAG
jgi:hypothetical protein